MQPLVGKTKNYSLHGSREDRADGYWKLYGADGNSPSGFIASASFRKYRTGSQGICKALILRIIFGDSPSGFIALFH